MKANQEHNSYEQYEEATNLETTLIIFGPITATAMFFILLSVIF